MCVSGGSDIMLRSLPSVIFEWFLSASSRRTSTKSGSRRSAERCWTKPKECAVKGQLFNFHVGKFLLKNSEKHIIDVIIIPLRLTFQQAFAH